MHIHRFAPLVGPYALATVPKTPIAGITQAMSGLVRFGAGQRSPDAGMRTSAVHELGYVVRQLRRVMQLNGRGVAGDRLPSVALLQA